MSDYFGYSCTIYVAGREIFNGIITKEIWMHYVYLYPTNNLQVARNQDQ